MGFGLFYRTSLAQNLGVIGTTYPIAETDFLEWIQHTLSDPAHQQTLSDLQSEKIQALQSYAERPDPVGGLSPAIQTKSWLYDPSITLSEPLLDAQGQVRYPIGSQLNPLDRVAWQKTLLFFNADNKQQTSWALAQQKQDHSVIPILVAGSLSEARKVLGQRVYFDQGGILTHRLGIQHIPAAVKQAGEKLQITEFKLEAE